MPTLNIRAYKRTQGLGTIVFETKMEDVPDDVFGFDSIKSLAEYTRKIAESFFKKNGGTSNQVSIDFEPFHEIEWTEGLFPVRCFPLAEEEICEFLKHFGAI